MSVDNFLCKWMIDNEKANIPLFTLNEVREILTEYKDNKPEH